YMRNITITTAKSATYLENVGFERFHRGERHADIAGGSGLGLSIARTFVEANGGSIEPLSEGPGKGTKMRIWLPLAPVRRIREGDDD
ncbi:ATP-binding protein, partial [Bosea vestrisii]